MPTFQQAVLEILHKRGATEFSFLVRTALKTKPLRESDEMLMAKIMASTFDGESGIKVTEYPTYSLKPAGKTAALPSHGYLRAALLALREERRLSLPILAQRYNSAERHAATEYEFWMWRTLRRSEFSRLIAVSGALRIDLTEAKRKELDERDAAKTNGQARPMRKTPLRRHHASILRSMDEKSVENWLAGHPQALESGLRVIGRQYSTDVGIIDLLCMDRSRNYVVVEIKRPAANDREIIGQITSYMGWIHRNMPNARSVRGIVVVGSRNERLECSLASIPAVSLRTLL